jgi:uncharacterized protein with GYD domain
MTISQGVKAALGRNPEEYRQIADSTKDYLLEAYGAFGPNDIVVTVEAGDPDLVEGASLAHETLKASVITTLSAAATEDLQAAADSFIKTVPFKTTLVDISGTLVVTLEEARHLARKEEGNHGCKVHS